LKYSSLIVFICIQRAFKSTFITVNVFHFSGFNNLSLGTRRYKFDVDGKSVRVCLKFFIATLGIGIKTVDYALKRKQATDSPIRTREVKELIIIKHLYPLKNMRTYKVSLSII
jgi:hypothetical protein